jgi:Holliday junction resolvase-like predicted endonuclease
VETVSHAKRQRVIRAARLYAAAHRLSESPLRFDVIAIDGGSIRHEEGAFDVDGK